MVYNLVRIETMSTVKLSEAKTHLARLLKNVQELGEQVIITRSGEPAGVLISHEEYEGLLETLDILGDPELAAAVRKGLEEAEHGELKSHDEVWGELDDSLHP
jgi:prevent-host-death family protein